MYDWLQKSKFHVPLDSKKEISQFYFFVDANIRTNNSQKSIHHNHIHVHI